MNSNQTYIKTFSRDIKPSASVNTNISIPIENSKTKNGQVDGATLADDETRTESFRSLKSRFENLTLQQSQASGSTFVLGGGVNVNGIQKANKPQPQHKQQLQNESVSELRQDESLKINDQRNSPKPPVNLTASNALKPPKPALPQRSPSKPISRSTSSYITNSATDLRKLEDHHDPFDDSQGIDPFADDNDLVDEPLPIETPSSNVRVPRAKPHTPPECKGNKPPLPDRPQMPPPPLPNRPSSLRSQTGTTISGEEGKSRKRRTSFTQSKLSENNHTDSNSVLESPDLARSNRKPPEFKGIKEIHHKGTTRAFAISGKYIITDSGHTRVWSIDTSNNISTISHEDTKITSLCWRPTRRIEDVGRFIWGGGQDGNIFVIDIIHGGEKYHEMTRRAHNHSVNFILRHEFQLWTLDDSGKLLIWSEEEDVISLRSTPKSVQITAKQNCALVVGHHLWTAAGKIIEIFNPLEENRTYVKKIDIGIDVGNVKCMTQTSDSSLVYVGHEDGKITAWSVKTFDRVLTVKVSVYNITSILGVGDYLWVGFMTGKIYIYDVTTERWNVVKDWKAHKSPVIEMQNDEYGLWEVNRFQVASCSAEGQIKVWDGLMGQDWIADEMSKYEQEYCDYRDIKVLICSWNIDASKPTDLERSHDAIKFLRLWFTSTKSPDIIVIGFQEIIDLESKKQTAKTILTKKKVEKQNAANLTQRYKAWHDKLVKAVREYATGGEQYEVISSDHLVGLFTCIFVKKSERGYIDHIDVAMKKTGLKGYHGNKGSIATRFVYEDSSICFVNCHLAAGQAQIKERNTDVGNILDNTEFPLRAVDESIFVHGGDGTMISDHEICFLSGDLNYRIDMSREDVLKAVKNKDYALLLEHDQLYKQFERNPGFRLRPFSEGRPNFAPTYKYNPGEDQYDTSEKKRTPAWCDRILYRGPNIAQEHYERYECNVSDHRPISGAFKLSIKTILKDKRFEVEEEVARAWGKNVEKEKTKIKEKFLKSCGFEHKMVSKTLKETNGNLRKAFDFLKNNGTDERVRRKRY